MYIFLILSYFFKKVGDQEAIKLFIDLLFKIPKALRNLLGIVILLGIIYFSYSKIYTNEILELRTEVKNVKVVVEDAVDKDDYADDIYYLLEVINIEEEINRHAYQTMQLELDLVYRFVSQNHPADPMLLDIKALKERNEYTYHFFGEKYKRAMDRCNNSAKYKKIEISDSLEFKDK